MQTIIDSIDSFFIIDIIVHIVKGIVIGILVSAPMGPIGILCVQRTLSKGRRYGFVTGLGASLSDMIYAVITCLGMGLVDNLLGNTRYNVFLQIVASIVLMIFGIYTFRNNPMRNIRPSSGKKGSFLYNFFTSFLLTFSNPLIILLFATAYTQLRIPESDNVYLILVSFIGILVGALLWWFGLTWFLNKIRKKYNERIICRINRIIGSIVVFVSVVCLTDALSLSL